MGKRNRYRRGTINDADRIYSDSNDSLRLPELGPAHTVVSRGEKRIAEKIFYLLHQLNPIKLRVTPTKNDIINIIRRVQKEQTVERLLEEYQKSAREHFLFALALKKNVVGIDVLGDGFIRIVVTNTDDTMNIHILFQPQDSSYKPGTIIKKFTP